jgi:hypothetical protein
MFCSSIFVKNYCSSLPLKYFKIVFQSGGFSKAPKFGRKLPLKILSAVDLPVPFDPTKPSTWPGLGVGNLCNLNAFAP